MTPSKHLSTKNIPINERLIFALDVPDNETAKRTVDFLDDSIAFYKIGLELLMGGEYFEMIQWLKSREKKVFVDLKFFDVPETVQKAVRQLKKYDVSFVTIHGNENVLKAAVAEKNDLKILAVTVLTSFDENDMADFGLPVSVKDMVLSRARRALAVGCDGVISSGLEACDLRDQFGEKFLIVAPGIRPVANVDDQKRTVDVEDAFHNGADYIVVGRPISQAENIKSAADNIQQRIRKIFIHN